MSEAPIIIGGIPIPFQNPALLAVLAIHVLAGLVGVIAGVLAMLSKKGIGRHSASGIYYYRSLSVVSGTAMILAVTRWTEDYYLAMFGTLAFAAAFLGRRAIRSQGRFNVGTHITGMGLSYTLMLVAFYLDNGRNLPLWRDLPATAYWIAPGAVGTVLILRALLRYRRKVPGPTRPR